MTMPPTNDDDYLNALDFVTNLPPNMRVCRGGRNHNFLEGEQVSGSENSGIIHTETLCSRGCGVIKVEEWELTRGYYVKDAYLKYPKPYLIKPDDGPINRTDLSAAFRMSSYFQSRGESLPKVRRLRRKKSGGRKSA